jgi:hypothetical protein
MYTQEGRPLLNSYIIYINEDLVIALLTLEMLLLTHDFVPLSPRHELDQHRAGAPIWLASTMRNGNVVYFNLSSTILEYLQKLLLNVFLGFIMGLRHAPDAHGFPPSVLLKPVVVPS